MTDTITPAQNIDKGRHYAFIKNTTNDTFKNRDPEQGPGPGGHALEDAAVVQHSARLPP